MQTRLLFSLSLLALACSFDPPIPSGRYRCNPEDTEPCAAGFVCTPHPADKDVQVCCRHPDCVGDHPVLPPGLVVADEPDGAAGPDAAADRPVGRADAPVDQALADQTSPSDRPSEAGAPDGCLPPLAGCESGAGTRCESSTIVLTCSKDSMGCVTSAKRTTCPAGQPCTGTFPTAGCSCPQPPPECMGGAGTFCSQSGQLGECAADPTTGCISVTHLAGCATTQSCQGTFPNAACKCMSSLAGKMCNAGCGGIVDCAGNCSCTTSGLVAYFPFDGDGKDASGNGNDGTVMGPKPTMDRFGGDGRAMMFNGDKDVIVVANEMHFDLQSFSLTAFIKVTRPDNPENNIFFTKGAWYGAFMLQVVRNGSNFWKGFLDYTQGDGMQGESWSAVASKAALPVNAWVHVAVTRAGDKFNAYVDGVQQTDATAVPPIVLNNGPVVIGGGDYGHFGGAIDDVRIYNRALTPAEVKSLSDVR